MRSELECITDGWASYRVIADSPNDIPLPTRERLRELQEILPELRPTGLWRLPGLRFLWETYKRHEIRQQAYNMCRP